ncbi:MAG: DUF1573 domain-containing protein [Candidatus Didemnitutus sp.]|nr:DUF1573 domain-containing protein [Candidatus Didemnitutus sp.]
MNFGGGVRHAIVGALVSGLPLSAAGLNWISTSVDTTTAPFQATLDVAFGFKNPGNRLVTVLAIQTNCECLAATTDRPSYEPGATGVVTARFTVGDRLGLYERSITVVTDDGSPPQRLAVRVMVPEVATLTPQNLTWPIGGIAGEKTVEVSPTGEGKINFVEAFASSGDFRVRLEVVSEGRHYRLQVMPLRTDAPASAAIRLKGATASGQEVVVSAYASVR